MPATISIKETDVFTALRAFLLGILPTGIEVVKAQENGVAEPAVPDFVTMNVITMPRLSTNVDTFTDPGTGQGTRNSLVSMALHVQLNVHGPNSADNTAIIATLFRDEYGCNSFASVNSQIQPLYCEEPKQMPFINGENQFEQRWIIDAAIQYNPITQTPQDFANTVKVNTTSVQAAYPPGA
ncbi:hypothetical protein N5B55_10265 [Ralstonia pickettii]|uniref:phage neck terminator protein n=1 Tax=Ralstonia pickettii TaxID=329 RepID=UPI002714EAA1|nr:hypothetical protein [Ralstonia pickettii]WKZ84169.1 hypothetical protein N5B55_10265 [Ralstonia pickettii]